ncbi:hypothetical protein NQD34_017272 [Periophthalmus magnuspinnatus]|nr:hypothetical protein NQD34_017272 [Periophthalmus magnuspinnatus]
MMDSQRQTEMLQKEIQEERGNRPTEDITEEHFLKELYLFMKKRDTPIERIPHLGFKQIDLYVMFKTVKELGGYHQVTAQQLWKQVYNTLGGNPRSTSAATCTRRHYEKLLLPYECHIKGLRLNAVQQPRHYHYVGYGKNEEDGPLPAKRRPVLFPLQSPPEVLSEHHSGLFPLSPSYAKFYYPPYPYPPLPQSLLPSPRLPVTTPTCVLSCTPPYPTSQNAHLRRLIARTTLKTRWSISVTWPSGMRPHGAVRTSQLERQISEQGYYNQSCVFLCPTIIQ